MQTTVNGIIKTSVFCTVVRCYTCGVNCSSIVAEGSSAMGPTVLSQSGRHKVVELVEPQ